MAEPPARDPFARLRGLTAARIGLGRSGAALPTGPMLAFQHAHARARDAVHAALDTARLACDLDRPSLVVTSRAPDRETYLRDPGLGRQLDPDAAAGLDPGAYDLAILIGDGLSATAVQTHAPALVAALGSRLPDSTIAPIVIATRARVALGDSVGEKLGARAVLVLIGERPGLSAADSIGAYLTWAPRRGRRDSERNCVSNIRPGGLAPDPAAERIAWLLGEARRLETSGVALKDRSGQPRIDSQSIG